MSSLKLNHINQPHPDEVGATLLDFLVQLGGASIIHIDGRDKSRCRVLVTLLHGNEPSGLKAVHKLLKEGFVPEVNLKIVIASVVAARTEPVFYHRMLPGQQDLNRCFNSNRKDLQTKLAHSIQAYIDSFKPEAVVDLHNTSGSGPAFCVSTHQSAKHLTLASFFTHRLIYTDIRLGSIMEQDFNCPIITVEAGGAQDAESDIVAYQGLKNYFSSKNIFVLRQEIELLALPRRLELQANTSISYNSEAQPLDITLRQDLESFNFCTIAKGTTLGWSDKQLNEVLCLDRPSISLSKCFEIKEGLFRNVCKMTLFMVTTRVDIATSDCLFYFAPA
uniref:succinylglutamate desuccinylase/aspartoacylase domain-containing protein n=1 Tax=Ningiella ruwaisensis TaxID=2364274 RepID=UPI0010A0335D|nr:succinylglutamate desuccinylase/aspartoacylase family protein [Ningiella ruwaisensis]